MTSTRRSARPTCWPSPRFVVVLTIYLVTLAPTTAFWDTSEYIAAAKVLGIPHPPGNPLFVILAHMFGLLPLAASYAVRINLFAAVTSAAAAGLWFLVAERWLRGIVQPSVGALRGGVRRRAGRGDVVDRVEPVHGEREGLHRLAALHGAGDVAGGALGRRRARARIATAGWS